jgi:lysozyme family protein
VPWTLLGITPKENSVVLFDLAIDNGDTSKGRTTQIMWNGSARNSSDRGAWGRLKLMR